MLKLMRYLYAPIAQMDRASDYESAGRGFESSWARLYQGFTAYCFFLLVTWDLSDIPPLIDFNEI
jgi:hypothetical protein